MLNRSCSSLILVILLFPLVPAWAVDGDDLVLNSGGTAGTNAALTENGYAGTYIVVGSPGDVTVTVNASGQAFSGVNPNMNIVLGDSKASFDVTPSSFNDYEHTFTNVPAGTYLLRTEYDNDRDTSRTLSVASVDVSGATVSNSNTDSNALAAADSYIDNFRQGPAQLSLVGASPGASVQVKLKLHDYNFGVSVPNSFNDTLLGPPGSPWLDDSAPNFNATNFKQALVDNRFNSLTAENAGKWSSNETTRDFLNTMFGSGRPNVPYMDYMSDYAQANNMRYRAHNLIWGPDNQQPSWVVDMLNDPSGLDSPGVTNAEALREEITERIEYYVEDRADRYYEIDVYNESYHRGSNASGSNNYWDIYGESGIAEIYKEVKDAIATAGADAEVFVNEYSALQNQGGDYYANWYMRHIEDIQNAGKGLYGEAENVVTGVGVQYYTSSLGGHSASRVYAAMNNLAVQGLPMHLTEWGVRDTGSATEAQAAIILDETARLMFGMPGTTGITLWNLRDAGAFAPVGTLYDADWSLRDTGVAWQALMSACDTDLSLNVDPNGRIDFTGFYGDYEVTIGGETFDLDLTKGIEEYSVIVDIPPDFNDDDMVDNADLDIWTAAYNVNANGDADGDGDSDGNDFRIWQQWFGFGVNPLAASVASVPEPATATLLIMALLLMRHSRQ